MTKSLLPPPLPERVRDVFVYDSSTGIFQRRVNSRRRPNLLVPTGGRTSAQGYIVLGLDGRVYLAHRLAWLYVPVTKRDPLPLGVIRLARLTSKPFSARIMVDRKTINLGYFGTAEDASVAYLSAKRLHHPGCTI